MIATAALEQLLQLPPLNEALATIVEDRTGVSFGDTLDWHAEAIQDDQARPDLEGRLRRAGALPLPVVKVEAKLHASLGLKQLEAYWHDLARSTDAGEPAVLVVLVPSTRLEAAGALVAGLPAGAADRHGIALSWDELLDALGTAAPVGVCDDIAQLRAMCDALGALAVQPFMEEDVRDGWRVRRPQLLDLATRALRQVTAKPRLNPIQNEPSGYRGRYIGSPGTPNLSLGAIDPFPEAPDHALLARFHSQTSGFSQLRVRLVDDDAPSVWFERDGHIWIPLEVPLGAEANEVVEAIRVKVQDLVDWAGVVP